MGKVVVYLRESNEQQLRDSGVDPAKWVRHVVKEALRDRARDVPIDAPRFDGGVEVGGTTHQPKFKPDPKPTPKKKTRR